MSNWSKEIGDISKIRGEITLNSMENWGFFSFQVMTVINTLNISLNQMLNIIPCLIAEERNAAHTTGNELHPL